LKNSLCFQGVILENAAPNSDRVFLCGCADRTKPSHDAQIASDKCCWFEFCLGCRQSEVSAEYITNISYRILQYEQFGKDDTEHYNAFFSDHHMRAKDTVKMFCANHPDGPEILKKSQEMARKCMRDGFPLLPPILNLP
jgi:hypothetical protein